MAENSTGQIDWNGIVTKIIGFLLVAAIVMIVETRLQVQKLQDFERYKALFWDINSQTKKHISRLQREHNSEHPDSPLPLYEEYDKTNWPE